MRINQVAKQFNVSPQTLRYWERIGLLTDVNKDRSGYRDYNKVNLEQLNFVICMRGTGMPIVMLQEYLRLFQQGQSTIDDRKAILTAQLKNIDHQMVSLRKAKQLLKYKIEHYDELFKK